MADLTPQEKEALEIFERFDEIAYGGGDLEKLDHLVAEDFSHHAPFPTPQGKEGLKEFLQEFREAFPDHTSTTEDILIQDDKIAVRYTARGTHKGEFMGIPATQSSIEIQGIGIYRVADGKVTDEWASPDIMGLMQQLGAIPESSMA